jgi:hypothetical protein
LGPAFLAAWEQSPAYSAALVMAFYGTMVLGLAGTIVLFGATRYLGPKGRHTLILVSAFVLAVLGLYQIAVSLVGAFAA